MEEEDQYNGRRTTKATPEELRGGLQMAELLAGRSGEVLIGTLVELLAENLQVLLNEELTEKQIMTVRAEAMALCRYIDRLGEKHMLARDAAVAQVARTNVMNGLRSRERG